LKKRLDKARKLVNKKDKIIKGLRRINANKENKTTKLKSKLNNEKKRIQRVFTSTQCRILQGKFKDYVHWNEKDITKCISLYSISKRAYFHLQNRWKYPLPSESTLKRWLQKIQLKPGELLRPVMNLLDAEFASSPDTDRITVLSIDEMDIDQRYCYDPKEDKVLGGFKSAYVVSIRGLFKKWKQAIQFDWEKMMTCEDLQNTIGTLYKVGIDVRAFVCDMGPKNQRLWRDLDLGIVQNGLINRTWFLHPVTSKKIYVFPDFPHLMKLLRNHTIDSGIYFNNGEVLNKELFECLLKKQRDEFCLTPRLTHRHIYLRGKQRQNVGTAFQLFDDAVSKAIRLLVPGKITQANFISLVSDYAQLSNVRTSQLNSDPTRAAYGMHTKEQDEVLSAAFRTFQDIRIGNRRKKTYAPFQKGILMHITSMQEFYLDLKKEYGINYVIPARLNQDHLENFFSQIRGLGGFNSNPTALEFQYRMKRLVTSHALLTPTTSSVCTDNDDCEMISSRLFHYLSEDCSSMPIVTSRDPPAPLLSDAIVDRLTAIDWNPKSHTVRIEDIAYSQRSEVGGMEYVSGFVARKLKNAHPDLERTSEGVTGFWIDFLNNHIHSNRGLTRPSQDWFGLFRKWEEIFIALHGSENVIQSPGVVRQFKTILSSNYSDVPKDLVDYYAKLRVLLRITFLNKRLEDEKFLLQERKRLAKLRADQDLQEHENEPTEEPDEFQELDILESDLTMIEELLENCSKT